MVSRLCLGVLCKILKSSKRTCTINTVGRSSETAREREHADRRREAHARVEHALAGADVCWWSCGCFFLYKSVRTVCARDPQRKREPNYAKYFFFLFKDRVYLSVTRRTDAAASRAYRSPPDARGVASLRQVLRTRLFSQNSPKRPGAKDYSRRDLTLSLSLSLSLVVTWMYAEFLFR